MRMFCTWKATTRPALVDILWKFSVSTRKDMPVSGLQIHNADCHACMIHHFCLDLDSAMSCPLQGRHHLSRVEPL